MFRLVFSLVGLVLVVAAIIVRGWPAGPALVEVIGVAGVFFAGSAVWNARALRRLKREERDG